MGLLKRDRDPARVQMGDIEDLGSIGRDHYVAWDGGEYILDDTPMQSSDVATRLREGEIRVPVPHETIVDGTRMGVLLTYRGREVQRGTYAALVGKRERRDARVKHRTTPRPVDRLADVGKRAPLVIAPKSATRAGMIVPATMLADAGPSGSVEGRPARRGVPDLVAYLASKRVEVSLTPSGGLYVRAPGGILDNDSRRILTDGARLVVAQLRNAPLVCELKHKAPVPLAVTIVDVDVAVCEEHA